VALSFAEEGVNASAACNHSCFVSALLNEIIFMLLPFNDAGGSYGTFSQLHSSCVLLHVQSMAWTESVLPDMPQVGCSYT
jgi:hypothetical protein